MAQRYTASNLENDVRDVNLVMSEHGIDYRYQVGGAYGRTELRGHREDWGTGSELLESGTAKECKAALYKHAYYRIARGK